MYSTTSNKIKEYIKEIKIGDIYEVHCYKHNGKIDRVCDEAMILDVTDDYIVCGNYRTNLTESNGKSHRTKEFISKFED